VVVQDPEGIGFCLQNPTPRRTDLTSASYIAASSSMNRSASCTGIEVSSTCMAGALRKSFRPYHFTSRQPIRLLLLRGDALDARMGLGPFAAELGSN
jgi:hypothetical protein